MEEAAAREQAGAGGSTNRRRLPSPAVPGSRYCPDRLVLAQTSALSVLSNLLLLQDLSASLPSSWP